MANKMNKLFIAGFDDNEIYACPFCFCEVGENDNYCRKCGKSLEESEFLYNINDFKQAIEEVKK